MNVQNSKYNADYDRRIPTFGSGFVDRSICGEGAVLFA